MVTRVNNMANSKRHSPEMCEQKQTDKESLKFLPLVMETGEQLLMNGAEVSRVEDTMRRICKIYGFVRVDVFSITSSIVLTALTADGSSYTQTRRILERSTDLGKVEALNTLSRRICQKPLTLGEYRQELDRIEKQPPLPLSMQLIMYMMISAALSVFFGGTAEDGICSAISGVILFTSMTISTRLKMQSIIETMICSGLTALTVIILVRLGIGAHPDKIMIGNIMLVIPGIQLTTSLRDMINGDTISGLLNLFEALLKAIFVAIGFAGVQIIAGGAL